MVTGLASLTTIAQRRERNASLPLLPDSHKNTSKKRVSMGFSAAQLLRIWRQLSLSAPAAVSMTATLESSATMMSLAFRTKLAIRVETLATLRPKAASDTTLVLGARGNFALAPNTTNSSSQWWNPMALKSKSLAAGLLVLLVLLKKRRTPLSSSELPLLPQPSLPLSSEQ